MINNHSWYCIGNEKFYNKNQALLRSNGDLSRITLKFMDYMWDFVDWTIEPNESWEKLCLERALELREKYEYLALWYSGGYDSHTILQTFIKNNILLDEIVIIDKNNIFFDSGIEFALKTVKNVQKNYYPNLNINIIEYDIDGLSKLYKKWGDNWIYEMVGSTTRLSKTNKQYYTTIYDHSLKTLKKENKRGNIMGHEKCKVYLHDNKWYSFFTDSNLSNFIASNHVDFYYSHKLYIKQVHNVINWFEGLPDFHPDLVHEIQGRDRKKDGNYVRYYAEWNIAMGRYPLDIMDVASTHGHQKFFYTEDQNSIDGLKILQYYEKNDKLIYNIYTNGLAELNKNFGQTFGINPTILSKPYYIRQANFRQHSPKYE